MTTQSYTTSNNYNLCTYSFPIQSLTGIKAVGDFEQNSL